MRVFVGNLRTWRGGAADIAVALSEPLTMIFCVWRVESPQDCGAFPTDDGKDTLIVNWWYDILSSNQHVRPARMLRLRHPYLLLAELHLSANQSNYASIIQQATQMTYLETARDITGMFCSRYDRDIFVLSKATPRNAGRGSRQGRA